MPSVAVNDAYSFASMDCFTARNVSIRHRLCWDMSTCGGVTLLLHHVEECPRGVTGHNPNWAVAVSRGDPERTVGSSGVRYAVAPDSAQP